MNSTALKTERFFWGVGISLAAVIAGVVLLNYAIEHSGGTPADRALTEALDRAQKNGFAASYYPMNEPRVRGAGPVFSAMTEKEVERAWGVPDKIVRHTLPFPNHEVWIYGKARLYFARGYLVGFEQRE